MALPLPLLFSFLPSLQNMAYLIATSGLTLALPAQSCPGSQPFATVVNAEHVPWDLLLWECFSHTLCCHPPVHTLQTVLWVLGVHFSTYRNLFCFLVMQKAWVKCGVFCVFLMTNVCCVLGFCVCFFQTYC